jgi:hypothetical protein
MKKQNLNTKLKLEKVQISLLSKLEQLSIEGGTGPLSQTCAPNQTCIHTCQQTCQACSVSNTTTTGTTAGSTRNTTQC